MKDYKRKNIPKKLRDKIKNKYSNKCGYCGEESNRLQIDHIVPKLYGGPCDEENLMPCCFACNNLKQARDLEEFRVQVFSQLLNAKKYSVNYRTALRFKQVFEKPTPIKFYFETLK